MNKLERYLVKKLREKLVNKFDEIHIHRKPSVSPKMRKYIEQQLGYIPILQPEIDMIFREKSGKLNAVEVKLLRSSEAGYNMPFYLGIGQALALHRFGFDNVALWLFVLENVPMDKMNQYGAEAWAFVRNDLNLPLDYTYFQVEMRGKNPKYHVMQYISRQKGFMLLKIDDPSFRIKWKYGNPIMNNPVQRIIRGALECWLNKSL